VSSQVNTWAAISGKSRIQEILDDIKIEKYKGEIERLRRYLSIGDAENYSIWKQRLPAVTFSGTFTKRNFDGLIQYNPVIVIDIDKLTSEQLENIWVQLIKEKYILSLWKSPSNYGLKGLVAISYVTEDEEKKLELYHKVAFRQISQYFFDTYNVNIDPSGSDITRLCFISSDKNLFVNRSAQPFEITIRENSILLPIGKKNSLELLPDNKGNALNNPKNRNDERNRKTMSDIIRYLTKRNKSITYNYNDWCRVGIAIANTFTFSPGLNYFMKLSALDTTKYDPVNCETFLVNCYQINRGSINFNTIVYLANLQGFKTEKQKLGVPKTEG